MPTYDYKCDACGHAFEKFHSIVSKPIRKCPKCGKNKVKRLVSSGAGLIFKGSGFYITDYRSENYKTGAKAAENASKPAETKAAETKTSDAKSSAAPEKAAPSTTAPPVASKSASKSSPASHKKK